MCRRAHTHTPVSLGFQIYLLENFLMTARAMFSTDPEKREAWMEKEVSIAEGRYSQVSQLFVKASEKDKTSP